MSDLEQPVTRRLSAECHLSSRPWVHCKIPLTLLNLMFNSSLHFHQMLETAVKVSELQIR